MYNDKLNHPKILTPEKFSLEVENLYLTEKVLTYLECVEIKIDEYDIDVIDVNKLLSKTLLEKITKESLDRNLLKDRPSTIGLL